MSDVKDIVSVSAGSTAGIAAFLKNPEILKMIYSDALQPAVKKVGKALETILGLGNTALLPLQLLNDKTNALFTRHMEDYMKRLDSKREEEICEVPAEIGIPIIERLTYTQDQNIAEMFIALLEGASVSATSLRIHPLFLQIVSNLAPDDAILLKNIVFDYFKKNMNKVPFIYIHSIDDKNNGSITIAEYIFSKSILVGLSNIANYRLYIDNLIALGLITKSEDEYLVEIEKYYKPIEVEYETEINNASEQISKSGRIMEIGHGLLKLTNTGESFIEAIGLL